MKNAVAVVVLLAVGAACAEPPRPAEDPVRLELFTCFHAEACFEALDAVLAVDPDAVIHAVPEDAAERALAVRLAQLRAAAPPAERAVWQALAERWRTEGALGVGPAHAWATPQATGVPTEGIKAFEGAVEAAIRAYRAAGGRDGPVLLRNGEPMAPGALAP